MKILALLLTISFHWVSLAQMTQDVSVEEAIVGFGEVAARAGDVLTNCNDGLGDPAPIKVNLKGDPNLYHKEVKLSGEWPNRSVNFKEDQVTILSEEEAQRLFKEFSRIEYMKFDYLHDGCFDRAHEFSLIAKEHGIEMGKVFLSDKNEVAALYPKEWKTKKDPPVPVGFVGWRYHVAPYVLVEKEGKLTPFVFDVGVAKKAKALEEWKSDLHPKKEDHDVIFRDRSYLFKDSRWKKGNESSIADQLEDQELIRDMGIDDFLFYREKGLI